MKKLLFIMFIMVGAVSFISCGIDKSEVKKDEVIINIQESEGEDKKEIGLNEKQDDVVKDEIEEEGNGSKVIKGEKDYINSEKEAEEKPNTKPPTKPKVESPKSEKQIPSDQIERTFLINNMDTNCLPVIDGEIKTVGVGVADNIRKILSTISAKYFDGHQISLTTIEHIGEDKIARINLVGDENYWYQVRQGSTGGTITQHILIENVLQRQYSGYWIEGVRFTVNGKPIEDNGHCSGLSYTTYR